MVVGVGLGVQEQKDISDFDLAGKLEVDLAVKLTHFNLRLADCGRQIRVQTYCKSCVAAGRSFDDALLHQELKVDLCGIRYCEKPLCVANRYGRLLERLEKTKRIAGLRSLQHFVIGFSKIEVSEFAQKTKEFERVIYRFFSALRRKGFNVQAFKVLDISKGKFKGEDWDGKLYVHYHFAGVPVASSKQRDFLNACHKVKESMSSKFHFQNFGLKDKGSVLKYLALRGSGLYKQFSNGDKFFRGDDQSLGSKIKSGYFMTLSNFVSKTQYLTDFWNKRCLSVLGNRKDMLSGEKLLCPSNPNGSNSRHILDAIIEGGCRFCGVLDRSMLGRVVVGVYGVNSPPLDELVVVVDRVLG